MAVGAGREWGGAAVLVCYNQRMEQIVQFAVMFAVLGAFYDTTVILKNQRQIMTRINDIEDKITHKNI
jgi:hypothetical protein